MIIQFSIAMLIGTTIPALYFKFTNKQIKIKGYHFHHTFYGTISAISSIPFILKDVAGGTYLAGLGIGIVTHHLITEKNINLVTKEK